MPEPDPESPRSCWLADYAARQIEAGHPEEDAEQLALDAWHAIPWQERARMLGACDPVRPAYLVMRPRTN